VTLNKRRWWKRDRTPPSNALVLSPQLIRSIVNDNFEPVVPNSLYDFVYELTDLDLEILGEQILEDQELWICLTDTVIAHLTSLKFEMIVDYFEES
jgi:hypothetical protein